MSKKITLSGNAEIRSGTVYMTVDALDVLKEVGCAYGLHHPAEEERGSRVVLEDEKLVIQEDVSLHGSPHWWTERVLTDDPEQIQRYMAFRETLKMFTQLDRETPVRNVPAAKGSKKEKNIHER